MKLIAGEITEGPNESCLICQTLQDSFHIHHVIPRSCGGEDGPLAKLCNSCHESIHDAAKGKVPNALLYTKLPDAKSNWNPNDSAQLNRATRLIQIIIRATRITSKDINKTTKMSLTLTGDQNRKLSDLSKRMKLSKQATVIALINSIK